MFCSCLVAQFILLLSLASVHKARRHVWMQICSSTVRLSTCRWRCSGCILEQYFSWQHRFIHFSTTFYAVSGDVSCMSSNMYPTHFLLTIANLIHLELACLHWPLLHALQLLHNCLLVLGHTDDLSSLSLVRSQSSSSSLHDVIFIHARAARAPCYLSIGNHSTPIEVAFDWWLLL